ncbi:uncharacterized protein LOC123914118 isoform X1 [Trifolium pratense]|uniref:uncharacterized protein LOC123914118 isoform X1 n=1 Tax=Trifolium pratense TaxID=57577 RepID=UPI001E691669|nr:uncharacterized protein LOC123914118 isoform X1 [Trifolium pratense]XP_045821080.1 uncharacterized protein LOC123914118 isoform X1 [Trifolium pratense]
MDPATSKGSGEMLDHVDKRVYENLSHLDEGVATDAGAGCSLGDRVSVCGEDRNSEETCSNDLGLNEELKERSLEDKGQNQNVGVDPRKSNDELHGVDQGTSYNSSNSVNGEALETCVAIDSSAQVECINGGDNRKLEAKPNESGLHVLSIKTPKGVSETDKNSCVIDMNCGSCGDFNENSDGEMICRICHLASGQPLEAMAVGTPNSVNDNDKTGLIMLGCACKDELGIAHRHCAEAWFKIKGNRLCEICGETAKNISEVTDNGFMEEWCESGFIDNGNTSHRRLVGCWTGQPFCNFLMACLVIAFVLPWFFRVKMF